MSRRLVRVVVALAVAIGSAAGVAGCSSQSAATPAGQSANQAAQVSPAAFADAIKKPGTILVDVRTPAEFRAGHLAAAVNIDVEAADFATRISTLDRSAHYAVYCRAGNRSAVAASQMRSAGITDITDLAGGINRWIADGRPTVTT